jgi:hypothetical protein
VHSIKTDLKRISFHDAQLEKVKRIDGKTVAEFDWAYLNHYSEKDNPNPIIIGKCYLIISGIENEEFRLYSDANYHLEKIPENIGEYWDEIQNTEIDDKNQLIKLDGMYVENKERTFWTEWLFKFENAELKWEKYITEKEWESGMMPE